MTVGNMALTAETMREVALHSEHAITPEIDSSIRNAAKNGKFEVIVSGELMRDTIKALMHRGFTVESIHGESENFKNIMDEIPRYTIGWV